MRFLLKAFAFALALGAAGLGADAQTALTSVHVGSTLSDDVVPIAYAQSAGLFARNGLDVQLMPSTSGAAVTAAVLSGSYEFGKSSLLSIIFAHLRGLPVSIIAADAVYDPKAPFGQIVVAPDATIASGKDFNGKTIGTPSLNDLNQVAIMSWIAKHGGDPATVKFVEIPNSAAAAAIADHRIAAAGMQQPALADAIATGKGKVAGNNYDAIAADFYITVFFTSRDYAVQRPDVVRGFARAVADAAAYQNTHHAETAAIAASLTKIPVEVVNKMPRVFIGTSLNAAEIQPVIDAAAAAKVIPHSFPARDLMYVPPK
jgi:NitT/TauT family transport system substrate-binding protein